VIAWLVHHDAELALPTVTIAEIAFGIQKIVPDQRATRSERGHSERRRRFSDRIFSLTREAALAYGEIMGGASRQRARRVGSRRHDCSDDWVGDLRDLEEG